MRNAALACISLASLAPLAPAQQTDLAWPGWRGPQRDGTARGAKPPLAWSDTETWPGGPSCPGPARRARSSPATAST